MPLSVGRLPYDDQMKVSILKRTISFVRDCYRVLLIKRAIVPSNLGEEIFSTNI